MVPVNYDSPSGGFRRFFALSKAFVECFRQREGESLFQNQIKQAIFLYFLKNSHANTWERTGNEDASKKNFVKFHESY